MGGEGWGGGGTGRAQQCGGLERKCRTGGKAKEKPGKREPRGRAGSAAVAWTRGNRPGGPPPPAPLSRWVGRRSAGRPAEPVSQGAWLGVQPGARPFGSLRSSRRQHPNPGILGRLFQGYTRFGSVPLLINPFRKLR